MIINYIWYKSSFFYIFLIPLSGIYILIIYIIKFIYYIGLFKIYKFSVPIVVIGNLTVGGTGKTPMVIWLVETLKARGWKVGVVLYGYKSNKKNHPIIINDNTNVIECGDEAFLIYKRTHIPVAISSDRVKAVKLLLKIYSYLDILISDDGLQHYSLGRDIEWIMINGEQRFGNGWVLPAGPMREFSYKIKKVNNVIVNGGIAFDNEIQMTLVSGKVYNLVTGISIPIQELGPFIAMAGIAFPSRFFSTIRNNYNIIPKREIKFCDHRYYSLKELELLTTEGEQLLMTEKDAVKCYSFAQNNWWYLPVNAYLHKNSVNKLITPIEKLIYMYNKIR